MGHTESKEARDSRRVKECIENEDKKIEGIITTEKYVEGNCGGSQSPPWALEPEKRRMFKF